MKVEKAEMREVFSDSDSSLPGSISVVPNPNIITIDGLEVK